MLKGYLTVAPHAPLRAWSKTPSKPEIWPRHYPIAGLDPKMCCFSRELPWHKNAKNEPGTGHKGR